MISIKNIAEKDVDLCYELDSNTISLWSKEQWTKEFKKEGIKVSGLFFNKILVGICVFQVVLDEAHINFFAIMDTYRKRGFGSYLMKKIIEQCEKLKITKILLEVSNANNVAEKFYNRFDFFNVGFRKRYYKDGSDAYLKEKKLTTK